MPLYCEKTGAPCPNGTTCDCPTCWASNEIVRLRMALEPFAAIGRRLNAVDEGAWPSDAKARFLNLDSINVGHFRQAGRVIEQLEAKK